MNVRRLLTAGVALAAGSAGVLMALGEVPRWRSGGSAMVLHQPLAAVGRCSRVSDGPLRLLFLGDSDMSGSRVGGPEHAFARLAAALAGPSVMVDNRAFGGAVLHDAPRQGGNATAADIVVILFGGNDAAPRGILSDKPRWDLARFRADMTELVRRYRAQGTQVLVLAPLPAGSAAMDRRIAPYRIAARAGAEAGGGCFRDPVEAFIAGGEKGIYLQYDGLHLNSHGQQALARWLAPLIRTALPPAAEVQDDG